MFNRSKRHIKVSAKTASLYALAGVAIGVITELTGYKKYRTQPEPKSLTEVTQEWPFFIIIGFIFFIVMFFWECLKAEKIPKICPKCRDVVSTGVDEISACIKCGKPLESLEGFFERHPE